jgi:2'-5' RNA ligase
MEEAGAKAVKWVREENIHLTLRFIGELPETEVPDLESRLASEARRAHPFHLHLAEPGCFPNATAPRVIWVGLKGELERLSALQAGVERASSSWGKPEHRPFHPHITLGRVTTRSSSALRRIGSWIDGLAAPELSSWMVSEVQLIRSVLGSSGSTYSTLATVSLGR